MTTNDQDEAPRANTPVKEPEHIAEDGTVRKSHYGAGRQPWDIIVALGWGAVFAAGNALKYVRRYTAKNGADDIEKGRWYYARLTELALDTDNMLAKVVKATLDHELTVEEHALLAPAA